MRKPTRAYLRTKDDEFRPLFWVHNNKPNEMLLGLYGLSKTTPVLRCMWPERTLQTSELANVHYDYGNGIEVGAPVDHITCHADGRFHVKTKGGGEVYIQSMRRTEPLGPNTSTFLELILVSDLARHYAITKGRVKYPHVWFGLNHDRCFALRGMFSGTNYPVEPRMLATMAQFPGQHGGMILTSGTLKGVLMGHPKTLGEEALAARPRGTLLSFKFPVGADVWHLKTFLFE